MPITAVSTSSQEPIGRETRSVSRRMQQRASSIPAVVTTNPVTPKRTPQRVQHAALSAFPTPRKYYSVKTNKKQKIEVLLTPSGKKTKDAIYKFRQKSTGKSYIGMTALVEKRVSSWMSAANNPDSEAGQAALAQEMRKNPEDFEFGIVVSKQELKAQSITDMPLGEIEGLYIEYYKQKAPLFNKRKGGGGGVKKAAASAKKTQKQVSKSVRALYRTPEKSYPLDAKTYKVLLTPSAKGDLYIIKRIQELHGKAASIERYIGKTERPQPKPRLAEHSHFARHPEKIRSQNKLYQDMHKFPEQFEVKILDSNQLGGDDIDMLERGLIEFFEKPDSENPNPHSSSSLYNKNAGGNGSHAARPAKNLAKNLFT